MSDGPLHAYRALRERGNLKSDPAQELAAEKLQSLHRALKDYRPRSGRSGWRDRLGIARRRNGDGEADSQGLYLFGPVGRGKSMLMDIFYASAPVAAKRRVHFDPFMQEVHAKLHAWRKSSGGRQEKDPLPRLAREIAKRTWLLCFDEFQVEDIADAMILWRLFSSLFDLGVVVVATTNTAPDDLYKEGLQRDRFLPFIRLLKDRLDILQLDGGVDHRLSRLKGTKVYHVPPGAAADRALDAAFAELTDGAPARGTSLHVGGRELPVPRQAKGVAAFSFDDLCRRPLGAADYLMIATHFHTLILSGIPCMRPSMRNEARRFVTLIDALYEHRAKLVCSAEGPPESLYPEGTGADAFRRAVSRLNEMQADDYLSAPHLT